MAVYGAGVLRRYTPDGRLDRELAIPTAQVTSCAFGGPGLEVLYVTTAAQEMSEEALAREPHSGALLACRPGVPGLPVARFTG